MSEQDLFAFDEINDNLDDDPTYELSSTQKKKTTQPKKRQIKPKVLSDWSDNEMFKLISCVECMPMLWIDNELMAKWSNMCIQYRSYFAKYRKTKSGQGASESVKWKFYDATDFVGRAEEDQTAATVSNLVC